MAYKIQYTPEETCRYPVIKQKNTKRKPKLWLILFAILTASYFSFHGIPDFLIPGDPVVTKSAVVRMVDAMKDGVSTQDAITVFCRQIIEGAGA